MSPPVQARAQVISPIGIQPHVRQPAARRRPVVALPLCLIAYSVWCVVLQLQVLVGVLERDRPLDTTVCGQATMGPYQIMGARWQRTSSVQVTALRGV